MTVADRMGQPAQAVVPAGGDDRVLSVLIHGFFTDQVSEYVIRAGYPPPVPVDVQGQVAFFVIPEGFCISCLVDPFPYLSEAVVAVPDGAAVPVDGPADLAGRGVFITFRYAVGEADAGDPAPGVQMIVNAFAVPVRDPGDPASGVVLIALKDFVRAVFPLSSPDFSDLSVQGVPVCGLIPEAVSSQGRHVLKVITSLFHHLIQAVGDADEVSPAVIAVGGSCSAAAFSVIAVRRDLFEQPVVLVVEITGDGSSRVRPVRDPVLQVILIRDFQVFFLRFFLRAGPVYRYAQDISGCIDPLNLLHLFPTSNVQTDTVIFLYQSIITDILLHLYQTINFFVYFLLFPSYHKKSFLILHNLYCQ